MTDIDPLVVARTPRRVTPTPSRRRRHPAAGARIVALGVGASTMFGLVATMGIAHVRAESTPSSTGDTVATVSPVPAAAPLTIVPIPAMPPAQVTAVPPAPPLAQVTAPATVTDGAGAPVGPIVLQARPDVRVVAPAANVAAPAAAPAPVATTRGSN